MAPHAERLTTPTTLNGTENSRPVPFQTGRLGSLRGRTGHPLWPPSPLFPWPFLSPTPLFLRDCLGCWCADVTHGRFPVSPGTRRCTRAAAWGWGQPSVVPGEGVVGGGKSGGREGKGAKNRGPVQPEHREGRSRGLSGQDTGQVHRKTGWGWGWGGRLHWGRTEPRRMKQVCRRTRTAPPSSCPRCRSGRCHQRLVRVRVTRLSDCDGARLPKTTSCPISANGITESCHVGGEGTFEITESGHLKTNCIVLYC